MPAVELARLRAQINGLVERFDDPAGFHSGLRDLLDTYANRAYRAGQAAPPQPLIPSYRVSPLVMRELQISLCGAAQRQPSQALNVVDALWRDPSLEPRLMATLLLGVVPADLSQQVVDKLRAWGQPSENLHMLDTLFENGTLELRRSRPDQLLVLLEEWLSSSQVDMQGVGLRALRPLIAERGFVNLPPVFRMLSPLVQTAPVKLQIDLLAVLEALIERSPTETAYFLRQTLSLATGPATNRLVRRCLPSFGPAQQASLRAVLQAAAK